MSQVAHPFTLPPSQLPTAALRQRLRRFTVDEYHDLIEGGYFDGDERYELLEGWIVAKMARIPLHDTVIALADAAIRSRLPADWLLRVQLGVTLGESEPEPDLAVVAGPVRRYVNAHPGASDTAVIVQVALSSLDLDRTDKGRIYALAGVPVYLILNVAASQVEMYTRPAGATRSGLYGPPEIFLASESVPLIIDGQKVAEIPVRELFP